MKKVFALAFAALTIASAPAFAATIVSTFKADPAKLYSVSGYADIWAPSTAHKRAVIAVPFLASQKKTAKQIKIALGYVSGSNSVTVSLNADNLGVPGAVIKQGFVGNLVGAATPCCTAVKTFNLGEVGVPLTAGTKYWVVVRATTVASPDAHAVWYASGPGEVGYQHDMGGGWQAASGSPLAYSVIGE